MSVPAGVGPHRVAVLRRAHLNGSLPRYCTLVLLAYMRGAVAPPATRTHQGGPVVAEQLAMIQAARDNAAYRVQILKRYREAA